MARAMRDKVKAEAASLERAMQNATPEEVEAAKEKVCRRAHAHEAAPPETLSWCARAWAFVCSWFMHHRVVDASLVFRGWLRVVPVNTRDAAAEIMSVRRPQ